MVWEHRSSKWKLPQEEGNILSVVSKQRKPRASRIIFYENVDDSKDTGPGGVGLADEMATAALSGPLHRAGLTAGGCHYIT